MGTFIRHNDNNVELAPSGNHPAVCVGIYDLGTQKTKSMGEDKYIPQLLFIWEISAVKQEGEYKGQRFHVNRRYTNSDHPKSNLRKDLCSWLNKFLTDDEMKAFDLDSLKNEGCLVTMANKEAANGKTYSNITMVASMPVGMPEINVVRPLTETPEWIQKIISQQIPDDYVAPTADPRLAQQEEENVEGVPF